MKLPRRVPFSSLAELDEICSLIFSDENDWAARAVALHRLAAWKNITTLPHALDSTHAILSVLVQDNQSTIPGIYNAKSVTLPLRQSYATSVIRLVNGLVDPLQVGVYARSIASIAQQLGLPAWLVELRHAATHEDLPSLEVLREAANQSMNWLLHNYFLPTLNPALPDPSTSAASSALRPLTPLLKQYKALLKILTKDTSLRTQYRPEIEKVERDVERWLAEAVIAADVASGEFGWDTGGEDDVEDDGKERWALNKFCDALLEKGMIVPLSKKKRVTQKSQFLPSSSVLAIWTPLVTHLTTHYPSLPSVLITRIISHLLQVRLSSPPNEYREPVQTLDPPEKDPSYDLFLASWVTWLASSAVASGSGEVPLDVEEERRRAAQRRENAFVALVSGMGPVATTASLNATSTDAARVLLNALCTSDARLAALLAEISAVSADAPAPFISTSPKSWTEDDMRTMDNRLQAILSTSTASSPGPVDPVEDPMLDIEPSSQLDGDCAGQAAPVSELPRGWAMMNEKSWKACPIGVFVCNE